MWQRVFSSKEPFTLYWKSSQWKTFLDEYDNSYYYWLDLGCKWFLVSGSVTGFKKLLCCLFMQRIFLKTDVCTFFGRTLTYCSSISSRSPDGEKQTINWYCLIYVSGEIITNIILLRVLLNLLTIPCLCSYWHSHGDPYLSFTDIQWHCGKLQIISGTLCQVFRNGLWQNSYITKTANFSLTQGPAV